MGSLERSVRDDGSRRLEGPPALLQHALGSIVMDVVRGEHRDPAMAMFGVVPREERSAEGDRGGDVVEAPRETDWRGDRQRRDSRYRSVENRERRQFAVEDCKNRTLNR